MSPKPARCFWRWRSCAQYSSSVEYFFCTHVSIPTWSVWGHGEQWRGGAACNPEFSRASFPFCSTNWQSTEAKIPRTVSTRQISGHRQDSHRGGWSRKRKATMSGRCCQTVWCHTSVSCRCQVAPKAADPYWRGPLPAPFAKLFLVECRKSVPPSQKAVRVTVAKLFWWGRVLAAASAQLEQSRAYEFEGRYCQRQLFWKIFVWHPQVWIMNLRSFFHILSSYRSWDILLFSEDLVGYGSRANSVLSLVSNGRSTANNFLSTVCLWFVYCPTEKIDKKKKLDDELPATKHVCF